MTDETSPIYPRVSTWVAHWLSTQLEDLNFSLLAGDGSTRKFYRVKHGAKSYLLMLDPDWDLSKDYPPHQQYLRDKGLPVPAFLEVDETEGILVMEDLGDELMQHRIIKFPDQTMKWLTEAAELLADLHGKTFPVDPKLPVAQRAFDQKKYAAEFRFTHEHLAHTYLNLPPINDAQAQKIDRFCVDIAAIKPRVFCHRDYHSRNLMIQSEKIVMIDFQDARMGSTQYDLASLIFDPYVSLSSQQRNSLVAAYRARLENYPLAKKINWDDFGEGLNAVGYQRLVKAAGSFASFMTIHGKSSHLCYLLPSLESAKELETQGKILSKHGRVVDVTWWIELLNAVEMETL